MGKFLRTNVSKCIIYSVFVVLVCHLADCEKVVNECGTVESFPTRKTRTETVRGEYPFVASLNKKVNSEFFCGGTLISSQHILSAAHCVQAKSSSLKVLPNEVEVLLGAQRLQPESDLGIVHRNVSEIYIHPEWEVFNEKYDADIAIFVLSEKVKFTNYIRPVCMPADNAILRRGEGSVVGWSRVENGTWHRGEFLSQAVTNSLNDSYCYTTDYITATISSVRTFCSDSGGRYRGDAGGGFFVQHGSAWVQYGILAALRSDSTGYIDSEAFAIYTNIIIFKNWIVETVGKAENVVTIVGEPINKKINLHCQLLKDVCWISGLDIQYANLEVTSFTGINNFDKTNNAVHWIKIQYSKMFYIPDGIGKHFKNLNGLTVGAFTGLKLLRRSNFENMENLENLHVHQNDIDTVDEDLLWDLINLKQFLIYENKIKVLSERTFEKNIKLKVVDIQSNHIQFLHRNLFKNNLLLEVVRFRNNQLKVIEIDFTQFQNIQQIVLDRNVCINAIYYNMRDEFATSSDFYRNLTNFQNLIRDKCIPVNRHIGGLGVGYPEISAPSLYPNSARKTFTEVYRLRYRFSPAIDS